MNRLESPPVALRISALRLAYGGRPVLDSLDFELPAGQVAGLIGPNGAGKSSLIRAIGGAAGGMPGVQISGQIELAGHCIERSRIQALATLGLALPPEQLPTMLSGRQALQLLTDLRLSAEQGPAALQESESLAGRLGLCPWLDQPIYGYSLGTRQKLAIVLALLGEPPLLVLDEVLNGLDPMSALALKDELRARADRGAAVLLATHGLEVAERFLDRCLLLQDGRLLADWDSAALRRFRQPGHGGLEKAVVERLRQARPL
ncbi:ATP-binding cassette domain-containing protein [Pseudomarimonas arenosa]|uniref:ABC transporter ATP-binding protein n=1 Tax=Pseudomarimonas arenosa TaxID=2774145 RepID=A0AAW3ZV19_9GAMM|nr:ABC transporter ATP-binding protein [Pseudomarimonas arenosa]MBD8527891.1 ABC transporter ATP-binding protein [Pseudomarimonas arenosa]